MVATVYTSPQELKRSDNSLNGSRSNRVYFSILFFTCLLLHMCSVCIGWGNTILDRFGFRQSQTAISTFYLIHDGWRIDYLTPVLGSPWSIPFEFPLYQWIVAAVSAVTFMQLDQAGRLVSLFFFYACLIPAYALLGHCTDKRDHKLLCLSLLLVSPVYIFWSRTFMIESLALFLSLTYLALSLETQKRRTLACAAAACAAGMLAGVTKVTTFAPFFLLSSFFFLRTLFMSRKQEGLSRAYLCVCMLLSLVIPLSVSQFWTSYTDHVRSLNPLGEVLVSSALKDWMFGSLTQRLQPSTWLSIYSNSVPNILGSGLILLISAICFVRVKSYRPVISLCLLMFLTGPALFTNVYFVHEYYCYATGIFLVGALGFGLAGLCDGPFWKKITMLVLIPAAVLLLYGKWITSYLPSQKTNNQDIEALAGAVRNSTREEDVLLIYGEDWDPSLPYYAERRALMRIGLADEPHFQRALNKLDKPQVGALIVSAGMQHNDALIRQQVATYDLAPEPVYQDKFGDLYVRRKSGADSSIKNELSRLMKGDQNIRYSIDVVQGKFWDHQSINLGANDVCSLCGWAVDTKKQSPLKVNLIVDRKTVTPGVYGFKRTDVAQYYKNPRWEMTGYAISFNCSKLKPGHHTAYLLFSGKDSIGSKQSERLELSIR